MAIKFGENFAPVGVLLEINGKVICHICGGGFKRLGGKHLKIHSLNVGEYRQEFGLNRGTPLCGSELSRVLSERAEKGHSEGILLVGNTLQTREFMKKIGKLGIETVKQLAKKDQLKRREQARKTKYWEGKELPLEVIKKLKVIRKGVPKSPKHKENIKKAMLARRQQIAA